MSEVKKEISVLSIDDNHKMLQSTVEALNQDFTKFKSNKVKVAGSRVRCNLLNCKRVFVITAQFFL